MIKRVVVKVGSSSLHDGKAPRLDVMRSIANQVVQLVLKGTEVAIVSSGAIAFGRAAFAGNSQSVESVATKQAFAALGQPLLMDCWRSVLSEHKIQVGQVLVTNQELFGISKVAKPYLLDTFNAIFELGIIPIINENDAVAVDEIILGDNDKLSAHIAVLIEADDLYLLSTVSAIYEDYPVNLKRVKNIVLNNVGGMMHLMHDTTDPQGRGGMVTKIEAAHLFLTTPGRKMYIVSASAANFFTQANAGDIGTRLYSTV